MIFPVCVNSHVKLFKIGDLLRPLDLRAPVFPPYQQSSTHESKRIGEKFDVSTPPRAPGVSNTDEPQELHE